MLTNHRTLQSSGEKDTLAHIPLGVDYGQTVDYLAFGGAPEALACFEKRLRVLDLPLRDHRGLVRPLSHPLSLEA